MTKSAHNLTGNLAGHLTGHLTGQSIEPLPFDLPRSPILTSSPTDWDNIQLALFHEPPYRIPEHTSPYHIICINTGKTVTLEQTMDGKTHQGESTPGEIGIYPAHLWQTFEWQQKAEFLQLYLEPMLLNKISSEIHSKDTLELCPHPNPVDPVISQIAITLQNTLSQPATSLTPGSKLYADTMANALATHLVYHYSSAKPKKRTYAGQLSKNQLKQVTEYIEEHLAKDISLQELANVVSLSSFHFARLFKQSTGVAPHQYHVRCRIRHTKRLLLAGELSIAQVAQVVGFSSHSHLNYHFKRFVGMTPSAFVRQ
ncbi:MAG: AraC family transcriptional regulator [Cyanobacteria bacterium P01_F01_bin.53]